MKSNEKSGKFVKTNIGRRTSENKFKQKRIGIKQILK